MLLLLQPDIVCQGLVGAAVLALNPVGGRLLRPMLCVMYLGVVVAFAWRCCIVCVQMAGSWSGAV